MAIGHECVAEVVAVGAEAGQLRAGQHVAERVGGLPAVEDSANVEGSRCAGVVAGCTGRLAHRVLLRRAWVDVAMPVGQVAAGPAALAIGTEPALLAGAGIMALAVGGMLASRDVRRLEHRLPAP